MLLVWWVLFFDGFGWVYLGILGFWFKMVVVGEFNYVWRVWGFVVCLFYFFLLWNDVWKEFICGFCYNWKRGNRSENKNFRRIWKWFGFLLLDEVCR